MRTKIAFDVVRAAGGRVAYRVSWAEVERVLGHRHRGNATDDAVLLRALRAAGARPTLRGALGADGWAVVAAKGAKDTPKETKATASVAKRRPRKRRNPARRGRAVFSFFDAGTGYLLHVSEGPGGWTAEAVDHDAEAAALADEATGVLQTLADGATEADAKRRLVVRGFMLPEEATGRPAAARKEPRREPKPEGEPSTFGRRPPRRTNPRAKAKRRPF